MWGTQPALVRRGLGIRFIPTHVGNTADGGELLRPAPVHPHACGEHHGAADQRQHHYGSSPRMWGTRPGGIRDPVRLRFIPTHVGNTTSMTRTRRSGSVHPHACGEHFIYVLLTTNYRGSSPRMWGTRPHRLPPGRLHRFIPTHVGNTACHMVFFRTFSVHPHACGEH